MNRVIRPLARAMVEDALSGLSAREREKFTDMMIAVKRRLQAMAAAEV